MAVAYKGEDAIGLFPKKKLASNRKLGKLPKALVLLLFVATVMSVVVPVILIRQTRSRSGNVGTYPHAAVAADGIPCSTMGRRAMEELGGNVVDAAVATALCQGVVHFQSSGIGGGGFLVFYNRSTGTVEAVNFREKAPSSAYEEMLLDNKTNPAVTVGVPGELKGLETIWRNYGQVEWAKLFDLVADLAENGFEVSEALESGINSVKSTLDTDERFSSLKELLAPGGVYLKAGDILKRPVLANTLRAIGANGSADLLYKSEWTDEMIKEINAFGGNFTYDDFASYEAPLSLPLQGPFMNMTMYGVAPPASGVVHQLMLNILSGFNMEPTDFGLLSYQRTIETYKFAYGQRNKLGDPVFEPDVDDLVTVMLDPDTANTMRNQIKDNATFPPEYYEGNYSLPNERGTTHFSIVDSFGNAVAMTSTVNTGFGSLIRSPSTGLIYNDEMFDFSTPGVPDIWGLPPDPRNFVKPGKQPQSSTCPSVLIDSNGDVAMVIGGSGGSRITTAVGLAVTKYYIFQKSLEMAIDPARPHHQLIPNVVFVENEFPMEYQNGLRNIGHEVNVSSRHAVVQGIVRNPTNGQLTAVCDHRKGGKPDGF
eukprot:m.266115 g.266115  ORF g.266115 m.266115 type:complete len:595 (+) comp40498_c2_seq1:194-1978(+)